MNAILIHQPDRTALRRRIATLAAQQHGVISAMQLLELGTSPAGIRRMHADGRIHRIHRGVYAVGHRGLSRSGRWMAAVLAAGEDAALSHVAAAQLWGITRRRHASIDVSTPVYRRPIPGVRRFLLRPMLPAPTIVHEGIPVTTVTQTLIDLACIMRADELAFVAHEAAYHHGLDVSAIDAVLTAHPRFRGRGVLREAMVLHVSGRTGARSRLEQRVHVYLGNIGAPPAIPGYRIQLSTGVREVDLAWPDVMIYAEVDGPVHDLASTRRVDAERDRDLRVAGWTGYRIAGDEFTAAPDVATRALRTALKMP